MLPTGRVLGSVGTLGSLSIRPGALSESVGRDGDSDTIDGFLTAEQCPARLGLPTHSPHSPFTAYNQLELVSTQCPLLCARDC